MECSFGDSYASLSYLFRIPTNTICGIVPEVCQALSDVLQAKGFLKLGETSKTDNVDQKNEVSSTDSLVEVSSNDIQESKDDFQIGEVVWAKIGRYPFWPSIVCYDPETNVFVKGKPKEKTFSLHVRFCNDNGRRSWSKLIERYSGKDDIFVKYPNCLSFIKNNKSEIEIWNLAVAEADSLLTYDREERIKIFYDKYNLTLPSASTSEIPIVSTPIDAKNNASGIDDLKMFNAYVNLEDCIKNSKVIKPKRNYTTKSKSSAQKKSKISFSTIYDIKDSSEDEEVSDNTPDELEIPSTLLHRLIPLKRKSEINALEMKLSTKIEKANEDNN